MFAEGRFHSYDRTYEPGINRSGSLRLRGLAFAGLAENDGPIAISDRASPSTPVALGDPPDGIPSSSDAQASLEASRETSFKADRVSGARYGESTVITARLF